MASIFTFDPDPPRVASPWATPPASTPKQSATAMPGTGAAHDLHSAAALLSADGEGEVLISRLEAEPQDGPTEYKLHLLLRPRRTFTAVSTGCRVSGSHRLSVGHGTPRSTSETRLPQTPPPATSNQSRQHRLLQLTTQLVWRLQQSCPVHSAVTGKISIPTFPDESAGLDALVKVQRPLPGLEETKGALYEIGISDDGTLAGLAEDEMEESLNTLRVMAASVGCMVDVVRRVPVGDCEWVEEHLDGEILKKGKLWVAEAYVKLDMNSTRTNSPTSQEFGLASAELKHGVEREAGTFYDSGQSHTEQLRVSLTGATMSGKSSLLGSLSTSTLDNGRGKSRLSLLKHRHEIASGMTSSVTQELIGYCDDPEPGSGFSADAAPRVINYATDDVETWPGIHAFCQSGRVVFLSDSAGHPRYRRTTVRGLIGWSPHWTLLCIPADNAEDTSGKSGATPSSQELLGSASADVDLSETHLELCLKLDLPLVIVITKLDLASKAGLRQALSKVLSSLKAAGKRPLMVPHSMESVSEVELQAIEATDLTLAEKIAIAVKQDMHGTVPILLTSAVKGTGLGKLHALLRQLPLTGFNNPNPTNPTNPKPSTLFHTEDVYMGRATASENLAIVSGILRRGKISVGDELVLGPYPTETTLHEDSDSSPSNRGRAPIPTSRSFPGALHNPKNIPPRSPTSAHEWRRVRVTSIRNLRLPVRSLYADQVGTMGLVPIEEKSLRRIRKGMVLSNVKTAAHRVIRCRFLGEKIRGLWVGSSVVVYVASVRASAKVMTIAIEEDEQDAAWEARLEDELEDEGFGFSFEQEKVRQPEKEKEKKTLVTLQFIASREFVEQNAKVLIMTGGGPGLYGGHERGEKGVAGLDGFVGRIVDGYS